MIRTYLYDAQGHDRETELEAHVLAGLKPHQLVWVDVTGREPADFDRLAPLLGLKPRSLADIAEGARRFQLANYGSYIHFDVATVETRDSGAAGSPTPIRSHRLDVAMGEGWVLTAHEHPVGFLEEFREQDRGETVIGGLTPSELAASLLDWHLAAYLAALEDIETFADRVDLRMLSSSRVRDDLLQDLVGARRYISSLRRSLAPQSAVFYGLSRPDFALIADSAVESYKGLERRFERVLDSLEHGRELIQSSFDLFTTRTAETTNALIRRLTFISILLGALGGVAGVFGMNFDTPYAKAGLVGFWTVVGALLVLGAVAAVIARARRWI